MVNGWKVTAVISMILAVVFLLLFVTMTYSYALIDTEWEYEYTIMYEDWCELVNEYSKTYNIQLEWLVYYDYEDWKDYDEIEQIDCKE